jgi:peptidyl-prolyl cis-trans isomerase D
MLDIFRQRGLSNVVYGAVIAATILAFVITFRPNATSRTASLSETCAAKVRGRCIGPKDFASAYRMLMLTRSQSLSRRLNLKKAALDGLIERELLDDEARRLGIGVADAEVTDQLYAGYVRVSVPAADPSLEQAILSEMYQAYARAGIVSSDVAQAHFNDRDMALPEDFRDPKTKMFDMKVYERQVRNLSNRSTAEFREQQTRELLAAKVRDVVRGPIRISEPEVWDEYERQKSNAILTYVPVKESWTARWAVDANPADIAGWAKDHKDEVDKAAEERAKEDAPQAGHIRHILVKLPYGATDDEKAVAVAKLSWAAARIRAGEAFAEVARDTSDDPGSAMRGGDVGEKTDGFVPPFRAAADALKPGESTGAAIETQFGYHFIEKDDPAKSAEIDAAVRRSVARSMYVKAKASEQAQRIAAHIDDAMHAGKGAEDAIRDAIAPYVRDAKVEMLKVVPEAKAGTAGVSLDGGTGATGATAAMGGTADAGAGAGAAAAGANAPKAAKALLLPEKRFDASTDGDRPQPQTSSAFNRGGDPFPGLSPDGTSSVVAFAFSAKDGDAMATPVRTLDGFAVVQLKQRQTATRDEFGKDRSTFEEQLLRAKRDEALSLYVKRLREQAKGDVKVEESYVREVSAEGGAGAPSDEDEDLP